MAAPAQWSAAVLARRRSGPYTVLTVSAPRVAERCRPGHYVSLSVAGSDSAMLLRRQAWIATSSASGRDGGALELIVDEREPGGARLAATDVGRGVDAIGPLGRPFRCRANRWVFCWWPPGRCGAADLVGGGGRRARLSLAVPVRR